MRKSRVLLAGVAVAAAAAATSAFTAGNTFQAGVQDTVAGYGEATVSGANITAIHYNHQLVFILLLLTHNEYDQGHWKKKL